MLKKFLLVVTASYAAVGCSFLDDLSDVDVEDISNTNRESVVSYPLQQQPQIETQSTQVTASVNNNVVAPVVNTSIANNTVKTFRIINTKAETIQKPVVTKENQTIKSMPIEKKQIVNDMPIPRDEQNKPIYKKIYKGSYKGNVYRVGAGDTIFLIAYITGLEIQDLVKLNDLQEPYKLAVGQLLKLGNKAVDSTPKTVAKPVDVPFKLPAERQVSTPKVAPTTNTINRSVTPNNVAKSVISSGEGTNENATIDNHTSVLAQVKNLPLPKETTPLPLTGEQITWNWPTEGRVLQSFSIDGGNKGIDIGGSRGQAIYAAAAGKVVYAGNAVRGYGNLILIKHNDDYLTAYAHNNTILVQDQQLVSEGQQIATMGNSGTNTVKLHFEIRYKAKAVNPLAYLK